MISQLKFEKKQNGSYIAKVNYGQYKIRFFGSIPAVYFYFGNSTDSSWCKKIQPDSPDWYHTFEEYFAKAVKECQERHEWFVNMVSENKQ